MEEVILTPAHSAVAQQRVTSADSTSGALPTVVSGFGGASYYYHSAEQLRKNCDALGLKHDIVEWKVGENQSWISICRKKVPFYLEMLEKHPNGILWLDVDTVLLRRPNFLANSQADISGFVRSFKYIRDFDPTLFTRFLMPFALHFANTPASRKFLRLMARLERKSDVVATDDYFLQEAWRLHSDELIVTILPPKLVRLHNSVASDEQFMIFGKSGEAAPASLVAKQHARPAVDDGQLIRALRALADEAAKRKDIASSIHYLGDLLRLHPTDQEAAGQLIRLSKTSPERLEAARTQLASLRTNWRAPFGPLKQWFSVEHELGNLTSARAILEDLRNSPAQVDRDFARSKFYLLSLAERARALGYEKKDRPKLWWMETPYPGNLGDIINPYIVEKLSGIPPRLAAAKGGVLAAGSIIKFATAGTRVWGTGTPRMTDTLDPAADYRAVRGPLTRQLVLNSGGKCPEVYGDPAWFLPKIFRPIVPVTHRLGLIRHINHLDRAIKLRDVREISVRRVGNDEIEAFITEVLSCEKIVSSSLHGIIIAHAYGVPAEWVSFDDGGPSLQGDGTKFLDYFASVGIEEHSPIDLSKLEIGSELADWVTRLPARQIDLAALARVAPFKILKSWGF